MGWLIMTREDKVAEFRRAGDAPSYNEAPEQAEMIHNVILEEFIEFTEAAKEFASSPTTDNRANLCKEWADLQYVVSQASVFYDIPADPAFNRVHASNMTKVVDGKVIKREDGKILKPDTYQAPDMRGL